MFNVGLRIYMKFQNVLDGGHDFIHNTFQSSSL